jgi:hypothetical protein
MILPISASQVAKRQQTHPAFIEEFYPMFIGESTMFLRKEGILPNPLNEASIIVM